MPTVEVIHGLEGEECQCGKCGQQMEVVGKKLIRKNAVFKAPEIYAEEHYTQTYTCDCHDDAIEPQVFTQAPVPKLPLSGSVASADIIAWAIHQKFDLSVPLYRQVNEWKLYGLDVTERTLVNWVNTVSHKWLKPLYELLHREMLTHPYLHADETPYQILKRSDGKPPTSQSRMWVVRTSSSADKPVIYYHSSLTRSQFEADKILSGFVGFLHADGFQVYKNIDEVIQVGCWAHVRRKFKDIEYMGGLAGIAVKKCNAIFGLEAELRKLTPQERYEQRKVKLKKLTDDFFSWIESITDKLSGKLEAAVIYAKNQKESLLQILKDGNLHLSNNICEQKMRPIAIGRKNYLFSTSEKGAVANAICYTLLESAKANGINPFKYLVYLLQQLPNLSDISDIERLTDFLPWSKTIKENCI